MNAHESARRRLLEEAAAALPALLIMPLFYRPGAARAGASKQSFHYQDHPNEGAHCANCVQFIPPAAGQETGSCQIVSGAISPNGWCMAFTSK